MPFVWMLDLVVPLEVLVVPVAEEEPPFCDTPSALEVWVPKEVAELEPAFPSPVVFALVSVIPSLFWAKAPVLDVPLSFEDASDYV